MAEKVGVMCADEGHYDMITEAAADVLPVGVMCADEGHYDAETRNFMMETLLVGVMCADEGHYDIPVSANSTLSLSCRSHVC